MKKGIALIVMIIVAVHRLFCIDLCLGGQPAITVVFNEERESARLNYLIARNVNPDIRMEPITPDESTWITKAVGAFALVVGTLVIAYGFVDLADGNANWPLILLSGAGCGGLGLFVLLL
jgi:hypothetical protein